MVDNKTLSLFSTMQKYPELSKFRLNEGFTVFLERKIVEKVYGSAVAALQSLIGEKVTTSLCFFFSFFIFFYYKSVPFFFLRICWMSWRRFSRRGKANWPRLFRHWMASIPMTLSGTRFPFIPADDVIITHQSSICSSVPYEKGYNFLVYLERLVGGDAVFNAFLKVELASLIVTLYFADKIALFRPILRPMHARA